jgi:signal transduction histidine kinase
MATFATASPAASMALARVRRFGFEALYLASGLLVSMEAFLIWVTGVTLSLTFALMIIGLPLALGMFAVFRWVCDLERRRAALVLGAAIPQNYRPRPDRNIAIRLLSVLKDPQSWKDAVYLGLFSIVGFVWGIIWITVWAVALGSIAMPAWWWSVPDGVQYGPIVVDSWYEVSGVVLLGLALTPFALALQRGLALSQAHMARRLLAPSLAERVEQLKETRAGAVDAAQAELQRIERDLHDGAQARLVALAMDLGMAEERFDRDPEGARELLGEAREEAKRALAELRDLARGMRPSLLAERGLASAIDALAARNPIPTQATVSVTRQPPQQVENTAWFVVSEALANAAKHSRASRVTVLVAEDEDAVRVEVVDDGRGGADASGSGLKGLAQRVAALDGALDVNSPPGGPTVIRAVIPCAW